MLHSWPRTLAWAWLATLAAAAVLAPYLPLPYPPALPDLAQLATPPSAATQHWLGTDPQGRDLLAGLLFGARTALGLAVPAAGLAALLGTVAGGAAGFWGNTGLRLAWPYWLAVLGGLWWGLGLPGAMLGASGAGVCLAWAAVARWRRHPLSPWPLPLDAVVLGSGALLGTVPRLVLVLAIAAGAGLSQPGLLGLLILAAWPDTARVVRAQMLRTRSLPFVEAAQVAGLSPARCWWHHALPHAAQPVRALLPLSVASLIGLESTLSFLGIGLPPETASWGRLISGLRSEPQAWWLTLPVILLIITVLSLQILSKKGR